MIARMASSGTPDARRTAGIALCLVSACGFGLMAIFAKEAYRAGLGVTALLAARFALAAVVFWAIVVLRRRRTAARAATAMPRSQAASCSPASRSARSATARSRACSSPRCEHIDASLTSLLLYTYPALVFGGAVALGREHVTPWKALALGLASAGAALVLLGGGTGGLETTGVALALGAGATYAVYILIAERAVATVDAFLLGALIATGAATTFLVVGAATGALTFTAGGWIWIAAIALLSTVLPIATFMLGMERVGASTASILSTVEPPVTVALAVALYGDALGPLQIFGGVLVLRRVVAAASGRRAVAVPGRWRLPLHAAAACPQLARSRASLPEGDGWAYEPKWDGFRAIVFVDGDETYVQSRNGKPLSRYFPELTFPAGRYVLDGEIVAASFDTLGQRIHPAASRIARLAEETPARFVAFDVLARRRRGPARAAPTRSAAPCSRAIEGLELTPVERTADDAQRLAARGGGRDRQGARRALPARRAQRAW